jgi:hypothetical protein
MMDSKIQSKLELWRSDQSMEINEITTEDTPKIDSLILKAAIRIVTVC